VLRPCRELARIALERLRIHLPAETIVRVPGGRAMSEREQPSRIETFLYDAAGRRTEDESVAVRGEVVELDAEGRVIATCFVLIASARS
jgi:YD repeat-containing protein